MTTNAYRDTRRWLSDEKVMLIGDQWTGAIAGGVLPSTDPSDGSLLTTVPDAGPEDVDAAVDAARRVLDAGTWARIAPDRRARVLWRLSELVELHADELACLDVLDNGKPLAAARRIDLPMAARMLRYWAGWPTRLEGATVPLSARGRFHAFTRREPVGVVGVLIPWNAPALFFAWKAAAALACGNSVVLKPADETPLSALRLAELAREAGLPPGALNVITGSGEVAGAALAAHPGVDKIAFTGSAQTGRLVVRAATGNMKKVSLELGGKSPNVVLADADLARAVPGAADACFFNQGCVCSAGSRLYAHASVFDEVLEGVATRAAELRLGKGIDPASQMGPLISGPHRDRVGGLVDQGAADGARIVVGGRGAEGAGYFFEPTVLVDAPTDSVIVREEVFGPVVVVAPFDTLDEAIALANDTNYGLAAGVWTRDLAAAHRFIDEVRAGTVWVNTYNVVDPALPFGGVGESGWGRDLGREAMDLYTQVKAVAMDVG